jgi:hypothetical protein
MNEDKSSIKPFEPVRAPSKLVNGKLKLGGVKPPTVAQRLQQAVKPPKGGRPGY